MDNEQFYILIGILIFLAYLIERVGKRVEAIYRIIKFGKDHEQ